MCLIKKKYHNYVILKKDNATTKSFGLIILIDLICFILQLVN